MVVMECRWEAKTIGEVTASAGPVPSLRAFGGCVIWLIALIGLGGCSKIRLPAIDPTGQRIFNPLPATTGLALPGSAGEGGLHGCLQKLGDPLNFGSCKLPEPAFTEPVAPPECLTPAAPAPLAPAPVAIGGAAAEPCVPGKICPGDCIDGPPAVLLGNECLMRDHCCLPKRGKRGCILLSPRKIVAPVGGEVVLLSGICGEDGYLQVAEPLEWMLTPESVGTFIQVGDDDPGVIHKLARVQKATKHDPSYAHGVTSSKRTLITRGNLNPRDDVQLEKGQTWITISSPSEGTSKVTVLAPDSECWDQRKATATIYWVDAARQFPGPQIVPAGTPVTLTTRVTRSEGTLPAEGWKVTYQITEPGLASFAGTNGSSYTEAEVDASGNATVELIPTPGTAGTTAVLMKVIRPGGRTDNMPSLTLFSGETFVTWSAPQLALRAGAPQIASYGVPFDAVVNVSNPGDQTTTNVQVILRLPEGVQATSPDSFATPLPAAIMWEIPEIPAKTQLDLFAKVTTRATVPLTFDARADGGLVASDTVRVDVYRPSLALSVTPEKDRYEVGEPVTFNIDVRNTGDRPLENLELVASGDSGMIHENDQKRVRKRKTDGPLQPGEVWEDAAVVFLPTEAGRRCIEVEATAGAGQNAKAESCVIVVNRPVPTPAITATLSGRSRTSVGNETLFRGVIANTGRIPLEEVRVTMSYDPQLQPLGATEQFLSDARMGQYQLEWLIPRLEPGTSETLEANFRAINTNPRSTIVLAAVSKQGARDSKRAEFEILPSAVLQPTPEPSGPDLPPASPTPQIPGPQPIPTPDQPSRPAPPQTTPEPTALGLSIVGPPIPVIENQPITYTLRVTNPSVRPDSTISIRFTRPLGVTVQRITQPLSSDLEQYQIGRDGDADWVYLEDIGTMRPNETIEYTIVLSSNQPQTYSITAEAVSRGKRDKAVSQVTTQVVSSP